MADAKTSGSDLPSVGYNLMLLLLVAALLGLGFAYLIDGAARQTPSTTQANSANASFEITVAGRKLDVPEAWVRNDAQKHDGFADRLDLSIPLRVNGNNAIDIHAAIVSVGKARTSAHLLDSVFLHHFESTQLSGPAGLIGKPLKAQSGYKNEVVWYDPLSINPFVAKCLQPIEQQTNSPHESGTCQRAVALQNGGILVLNFDASLLSDWRAVDPTLQPILAQLGISMHKSSR